MVIGISDKGLPVILLYIDLMIVGGCHSLLLTLFLTANSYLLLDSNTIYR